jgi:hypothetical protein
VPWKLRTEKLVVRSINNDGEVFEVVPVMARSWKTSSRSFWLTGGWPA